MKNGLIFKPSLEKSFSDKVLLVAFAFICVLVLFISSGVVFAMSNYNHCTASSQCDSGYCLNGVCCDSNQCGRQSTYGTGGFCHNINDVMGQSVCLGGGIWKYVNVVHCDTNDQCASGNCLNGVCCNADQCGRRSTYGGVGYTGFCHNLGETSGQNVCLGGGVWKYFNVVHCDTNDQCASGNCLNGVCCNVNQCGRRSTNGGVGYTGFCESIGTVIGQTVCQSTGVWKAIDGFHCSSSSECDSGKCLNGVCCDSNQCGRRSTYGTMGFCHNVGEVSVDNLCKSEGSWKLIQGRLCNQDGSCSSGSCTNGVCCNLGQCGVPNAQVNVGNCYDTDDTYGGYTCRYNRWGEDFSLQTSLQNENGAAKQEFKDICNHTFESVYLKICLDIINPGSPTFTIAYNADPYLYVVPYANYNVGDAFPMDVTERVESINLSSCSDARTYALWEKPTEGKYRVLIDFNEDGIIDKYDLQDTANLVFNVGYETCQITPPKGGITIIKVEKTNQTPLQGINFTITGPVTVQAMTDENGSVVLEGLPYGNYTILENVPDGWTVASTNPQTIEVETTQDNTVKFENLKIIPNVTSCGNISVFKCNDLNGDGSCQSGEQGLKDITFTVTGQANFTMTTDSSGKASELCVPPGIYAINEEVPSGWIVTSQNPASVQVYSRKTNLTAFANKKIVVPNATEYGSLKIRKVEQPCQNPISDVIFNITGPVNTSGTTDDSGSVIIKNLTFGEYLVTELVPSNWISVSQNPQTVIINSTQIVTIKFENVRDYPHLNRCGNLRIFKCNDLNADGTCQVMELGVRNITFGIVGPSNFTMTTDGTGGAYAACIPIGIYNITEEVPAGWKVTTGNPRTVEVYPSQLKVVLFGNNNGTIINSTSYCTSCSKITCGGNMPCGIFATCRVPPCINISFPTISGINIAMPNITPIVAKPNITSVVNKPNITAPSITANTTKNTLPKVSCYAEGQGLVGYPSAGTTVRSCCTGLTKISRSSVSKNLCAVTEGFICSRCGNSICGTGENKCNCPKDCNVTTTKPTTISTDWITRLTQGLQNFGRSTTSTVGSFIRILSG